MTPTLTNVMAGLAPNLGVLTQVQAILAMAVIPLFAWFNFNTWAGKNFEVTLNNPPRHFTTFLRYVWYAFLYTMIIEFVYIGFLVIPGMLEVVTTHFNVSSGIDVNSPSFQQHFPLWLLVFLISVVPNTPGLRNIERWFRTKLHHQAFIPAEAEALMNQFIMHPARFKADPDSTSVVMEDISEDIPYTHDVMRPDKRLRHRWFRMSYLYRKINEWKENPEIIQFYSFCGQTLKNCKTEYEDLQLDVRSFFTSKQQIGNQISQKEKQFLNAKKKDINKKLDLLLTKAYKLICCGVLATQKTHQGRMDAFQYFGLKPDFKEGPQVYVDIIVSCLFLSTLLTFFTTYIFHLINPEIIPTMTVVISWSVIMLFLQGTSIMAAVILSRRLSIKQRLGGGQGSMTFVFGPRTDISIGAMAGYLTGFGIIMMYAVFFSPEPDLKPLTLAGRIWPWPMIPATTSGFIIYYLYSLGTIRKRLAEGLIQGGVMGLVAAMAYIISMGLQQVPISVFFLAYCIVSCALTGFAIGWTFPEEYRRRKKVDIQSFDRRIQPRISVTNAGTLRFGKEEYPCQTVDLSLQGARLRMAMAEDVGTNGLLDLNDIGPVDCRIKRKEGKKTYLQFLPNDKIKQRLEDYIGKNTISLAYA